MYRLVFSVLLLVLCSYGVHAVQVLKPLKDFIKSRSDPDIAPVPSVGGPVEVGVLPHPINVADVDEAKNTIEFTSVCNMFWDSGISWNPAEFDGIEYITLPQSYFWIPPVHPFETASERQDLAPPLVTLFNNGSAVMFRMFHSKMRCDVSAIATGAKCPFTIAMWGYSKDRVAFRNLGSGSKKDFARYFAGSKYEIVDRKVNMIDFPEDGRVYQFASVQMTIKEKPRLRSRSPFRAIFQWE